MGKQIFGRARSYAFEQPIRLLAPGVLAGEDRKPDQVLRRQGIWIGGRILGGGAGSHHQALRHVSGEEVAASLGIGVVAIQRRRPSERTLEVSMLAGRLWKR